MAKDIIILILTIMLSFITCLHIYWMFGGKKWLNEISPFKIDKIQKFLSAKYWKLIALLVFSPVVLCLLIALLSLHPSSFPLIGKFYEKVYLVMGVALMLRGISVNVINKFCSNPNFIYLNSRLYSPLSNLLGLLFLTLLI